MKYTPHKINQLTKMGFTFGKHFKLIKGKLEWNLEAFTEAQRPLFTKRA